jgi:hypothetical protein
VHVVADFAAQYMFMLTGQIVDAITGQTVNAKRWVCNQIFGPGATTNQ